MMLWPVRVPLKGSFKGLGTPLGVKAIIPLPSKDSYYEAFGPKDPIT